MNSDALGVSYHASDFAWEEVREAGLEALGRQQQERLAVRSDGSISPSATSLASQARAWEAFHARHSEARFFKPKRYLCAEFPVLLRPNTFVISLGCGAGADLLPLLAANPSLRALGLDVSAHAAGALKKAARERGLASRVDCAVLDAAVGEGSVGSEGPVASLQRSGVPSLADACLVCFVLSALVPSAALALLQQARRMTRPGGCILVRDYGLFDASQLRFHGSARVLPCEREPASLEPASYRRQDRTLSTFYCVRDMDDLGVRAGLGAPSELSYACVHSSNRKTGATLRRVFVHASWPVS